MKLTARPLHNGKYVLNALLGQGIFGITSLATDAESGESVVLKTLSESLRQHPNFERFRQKFLVSARRLARCEHPNLVRVLGCFEDAGLPYLVMDYIPGQTLGEVIQAGSRLPVPQAIYYIRQIGAALNVLHQKRLLHRDVRPQNIIRRQGTDVVVLTDYGIACDLTQGVRQTHASLLSAGYAPPEQYLMSGNSNPVSDVYALAATFYCLLAGRPPVPASIRDAGDDAKGIRFLLPQLRQLQLSLSPEALAAVTRGLEIDPQLRPQSVKAWLDLLPATEFPDRSFEQTSPGEQDELIAPRSSKVTLPELPVLRSPTSGATPEGNIQTQHNPATLVKGVKNKYFLPVNFALLFPSKPAPGEKHSHPQFQQVLKWGLWIWTGGLGRVRRTLESAKQGRRAEKANVLALEKPLGKGKRRMPLGELMITSAIAAAAGVGFGLALRFNHPKEPGSTVLHTEQSFPPRSSWPVSDSPELPASAPEAAPPKGISLPTRR